MMNLKYLDRIATDPETCHEKPCIFGMRWPVVVLLDLLGSEMSYEEMLEDHPELGIEDIYAAINYVVPSLSKSPLKNVA